MDDAVVHEDVAPSTDVVTRAIDGGVQMAAVLADAAAPDPVRVAELVRDGVPHLPVRLRDGHGVVGPLFVA